MNKYMCARELIFRLCRYVSLGHLCSNSSTASLTTTSRNLTPAPQGYKIACKRVLFFDHGWAGYLTYVGSPTSRKQKQALIFRREFFWHDIFMARPLIFSPIRLNTRINAAGHRRSIAM